MKLIDVFSRRVEGLIILHLYSYPLTMVVMIGQLSIVHINLFDEIELIFSLNTAEFCMIGTKM